MNWNVEKEVYSSVNGPKEDLIVNIDLLTQNCNSKKIDNFEFSLQKDEFSRFYGSLQKLRDMTMNLLDSSSG